MMLAGGHGEENPNSTYLSSKGFYIFYFIVVFSFHFVLLSLPGLSISLAWTLTNLIHNLAHLLFLHTLKGAPWLGTDTGNHRRETHWEQIDNGEMWTSTKKILTAIPIVLFLLTCLYTKNELHHFVFNFISLIIVVAPKLPAFHHKRLFGINKY